MSTAQVIDRLRRSLYRVAGIRLFMFAAQDILLFYWWPDYADPYSWFINLFHTESKPYFNLTYYSNPQLDKMIDGVESLAATDRPKAIDTYRVMQEQLLQELPAISLYTQVYQKAMLSSVGGFVENPAYPNVVFGYELTPQEISRLAAEAPPSRFQMNAEATQPSHPRTVSAGFGVSAGEPLDDAETG